MIFQSYDIPCSLFCSILWGVPLQVAAIGLCSSQCGEVFRVFLCMGSVIGVSLHGKSACVGDLGSVFTMHFSIP